MWILKGMPKRKRLSGAHPEGEAVVPPPEAPADGAVETFGGKVDVVWDASARVTAFGPAVYFLEFLKTSGRWDQWVADCPLNYTSPNAPSKAEILGTILLSILAGHKRYAHMTAIRQDGVLPGLLGIERLRSEDAVRRALARGDEQALTLWMDLHLNETFEELLEWPWVLDIDATVKTVYGRQEEARVGYNPHKPGRPSYAYHTSMIAKARLVLNVDVHPGNQTASEYAQPGLWEWLEARPREQWPDLIRGDVAFGTERMMAEAEARELPYLFRLRRTPGAEKLLREMWGQRKWVDAGDGWQGAETSLALQGWSRRRRVIVLRRKVRESLVIAEPAKSAQPLLAGLELLGTGKELYEYALLVTTCEEQSVLALAQLYRDRGNAENVFDELKNQWGWAGFTTHDLRRSQLMARIIALVFNWWSLYTRLAIPRRHTEAVTSRPLLLHGIAKATRHSQQTKLTITSSHGKARAVERCLRAVSGMLKGFRESTEQLAPSARWRLLLRRVFAEIYATLRPRGALPRPA